MKGCGGLQELDPHACLGRQEAPTWPPALEEGPQRARKLESQPLLDRAVRPAVSLLRTLEIHACVARRPQLHDLCKTTGDRL